MRSGIAVPTHRDGTALREEAQDGVGGAAGGAGAAEGGDDFAEAGLDVAAAGFVAEKFEGGAGKVLWRGGVLDELGEKGFSGEDVGHGHGVDGNEPAADLVGDPGGLEHGDRRNREQGAFHGDCAGGAECNIRSCQRAGQTADLKIQGGSFREGSSKLREGFVGEDHGRAG